MTGTIVPHTKALDAIRHIIAVTGANEITLRLTAEDALEMARDADLGSEMRQSKWSADITGAIR